MRKIQNYVEQIKEELEGAKNYAEKAIQFKAEGNSGRAAKYREMASQELTHAQNIHQIAVEDIQVLNKVYTPPVGMQEKWDKAHTEYVEQAAWIRQMLSM